MESPDLTEFHDSAVSSERNGDRRPRTRTSGGRFAPGDSGGPGRPPKPKADDASARAIMLACTEEEWQQVHAALLRQAKKGSAPHIKILCEYNFAKPGENPLPTPPINQTVNIITTNAGLAIDASEPNDDMRALADLLAQRTSATKDISGRESSTD